MRIPEVVLSNLATMSKKENYKFQKLYRNLYNPDFFLKAYGRIYSNQGNMTKGVDGQTIDGMSLNRINALIGALKNESYQPNPVSRTYIEKKNGGLRPLGIPSTDDKLVQEVVRGILEAIYEPQFSDHSHGFRPKRSCHTALMEIYRTFKGVKWFVEGDIKGFFDNIDHHVLMGILHNKIDDEKFLRLIWKFLRAGYMEDWKYNVTYTGTPQGGIISPILANIYLNELDKQVEQFATEFRKGKKRKDHPEYVRISSYIYFREKKLRKSGNSLSAQEKSRLLKEIKDARRQRLNIPQKEPMDHKFKNFKYVRYADDFLIGVIGSKQDAEKVKADLSDYLIKNLKLELSMEKTLITHNSKMAKFLGFEIGINQTQRESGNRKASQVVYLKVPKDKWIDKLLKLEAISITQNGKWHTQARAYLLNLDNLEILSTFNAEIRGLYNYYKLAHNVSVLNQFHYNMEYSLYKTLAQKHKSSIRKIVKRFRQGKDFGIRYQTKQGEKIRLFYNEGFKEDKMKITEYASVDGLPLTAIYSGRNSLLERLVAGKCEWCGAENAEIEIHHVRKLKDLKGKKKWEKLMISRKRKTMAMCIQCHDNLHSGKLD